MLFKIQDSNKKDEKNGFHRLFVVVEAESWSDTILNSEFDRKIFHFPKENSNFSGRKISRKIRVN